MEQDVAKSPWHCVVDNAWIQEARFVQESQYSDGIIVNVWPKLCTTDLY